MATFCMKLARFKATLLLVLPVLDVGICLGRLSNLA